MWAAIGSATGGELAMPAFWSAGLRLTQSRHAPTNREAIFPCASSTRLGFLGRAGLVVAGVALRSAPSAADEPLLAFGVTLTRYRDPGERDFDRAQILVGKLNGGRPEVLVQAF
jgi:hypothetical protein